MSVRASTLMWSFRYGAWDWLMNFIDQKNDDSSHEKCPSLIFRQKRKKKTDTEKNKFIKTSSQFSQIV